MLEFITIVLFGVSLRTLAADDAAADAAAAEQVRRSQFVAALLEKLRASLPLRLQAVRQVDPEMLLPHYQAEFGRHFRPLLTTEVRFIVRICKPTVAERRIILAAGEASLQNAVRLYAEAQVKWEQNGFNSSAEVEWPDPRRLVLEGLAQSVEGTLSGEQAGRYKLALQSRAAARKRATVSYSMAKLDRALLLSTRQRDQILSLLLTHWQDDWAQQLERLQHGDQFLPVLPDEQVLPLLSDTQKEIWSQRNKRQGRMRGWTGFGLLHPAEEDLEAELAENPPAQDEPAAQPEEKEP